MAVVRHIAASMSRAGRLPGCQLSRSTDRCASRTNIEQGSGECSFVRGTLLNGSFLDSTVRLARASRLRSYSTPLAESD